MAIADELSADRNRMASGATLKVFAALIVVTFLLRIAYAGHLFQDDGLWFTAGEELARGHALYREIYFDKPPILPLVYAALFKAFGAHLLTIRLFTVLYSLAISAVLYNNRMGLLAAALFTFFSTTSVNNHLQGLNTDFLMMLPYTASAYVFIRSLIEQRKRLALIGGIFVAVAVQTNPRGIVALVYFAILLIATSVRLVQDAATRRPGDTARDEMNPAPPTVAASERRVAASAHRRIAASLFAMALAGFIIGTLPFLIYLAATESLSYYWLTVWQWGAQYASYNSGSTLLTQGLRMTARYFLVNNTLLVGLMFVVVFTIQRARRIRKTRSKVGQRAAEDDSSRCDLMLDAALLLWFAMSFAGMAVGGRFYSNYFFHILPSLCLIGARGLVGFIATLPAVNVHLRRLAFSILGIGFIVTFVRFHGRTAILAADWMSGTRSRINARWYHDKLNREERMVAAVVSDLPDPASAAERLNVEAMRRDSPRTRGANSSSDYLFIWGSRVEIYYWSGLLPASRYLIAQPLTGVPADVQHDSRSRPVLDASITAANRATLIVDLEQTKPRYLVDEIGFFNAALALQSFPETREFLKRYTMIGATGSFLIYRRMERDIQ